MKKVRAVASRHSAVAAAAVCWFALSALPLQVAEGANSDYVETVFRGVQHRTAVVQSMSGTAIQEHTVSAVLNAEEQKDLETIAQAQAVGGSTEKIEMRPLDRFHSILMDFSLNLNEGRWRYEAVDLTNSGHVYNTSDSPGLYRDWPAWVFYQANVCDGKKVYKYDRAGRRGFIWTYDGDIRIAGDGISAVQHKVLEGALGHTIRDFRAGGYAAAYVGEEVMEGQACAKIVVLAPNGEEARQLVTSWVAPELDYATVRQEIIYFKPAASPDAAPTLLDARVIKAEDFRKVSGLLWCPFQVQLDILDYRQGQGEEAWSSTRVLRMLSLEANTPVDGIVTPYPFPFDTRINDNSEQQGYAPPAVGVGSPTAPDALGVELTAAQVQSRLRELE